MGLGFVGQRGQKGDTGPEGPPGQCNRIEQNGTCTTIIGPPGIRGPPGVPVSRL